jgi:prefoldin alpha subunit
MSEEKEDKNSRREKLLELQYLDSQIKQIEQQMTQVEEQIFEVDSLIENLSELKETKKGQELLVPVANGIFLKANIEDVKNLKVNVGGGVVVEKTIDETVEMLKEQIRNIEIYKNEMLMQLQELIAHASLLQANIVGEE